MDCLSVVSGTQLRLPSPGEGNPGLFKNLSSSFLIVPSKFVDL
jgi:hypothetical protein